LIGSEESTFSVVNVDEFNSTMDQITGAIAMVVIPITMIILVVGGIVVMNIMLVSVTERTKEIGVRKAVGATKLNILSQFLIEAVVLTAIGGVLGLAAGELAGYLMNKYSPLPAFVPLWAIGVGIGVSGAVGIVFGLWPAWKAARLNPIDALRWE
jgi:putative ABC transport system permease protein